MNKLSKFTLGLSILLVSTTFIFAQNNALNFDGTDDYVKTNSTFALPTSSGTFEGWIWAASGETNNSFWGNTVGEAGKARGLRVNNGATVSDDIYFYGYNCDATFTDAFVGLYDKWTHVALVINSTSSISLYLNGKLIETKSLESTLQAVTDTFLVGDEQNTTAGFFKGKIDEIRVLNTALDAATIRDWMYKEVTSSHPQWANMLLYYKFNETSGTTADNAEGTASLDGTLNSFTFPGVTSGAFVGPRNALDFDGTNDYVEVADHSSLDITSAITLEAWIKLDTRSGHDWKTIIRKPPTQGHADPWLLYSLNLNSSNEKCYFGLSTGVAGSTTNAISETIVPLQTWTHVAGTWDGSEMRIYINGILENSQSFDGSIGTSNYDLYIGRSEFGESHFFDGIIDEVRIWNVVLPADTIRKYMCQKVTSSHGYWSNLKGYWRFDEGSGQTAYDQTANNNDGTLGSSTGSDTNDPSWVTSGAAIGDASAYDYTGSVVGDFSASLTHTDGDDITVTGDGGTVTGIQAHRVDEAPNVTTLHPQIGIRLILYATGAFISWVAVQRIPLPTITMVIRVSPMRAL